MVIVKLKGPYAPDGTDIDRAYTYFKDKEYVYLYDNDYQLNKRLYPIANVARLDIK